MKVYLDNAATTKPYDEVVKIMSDIQTGFFGNPSSMHEYGRASLKLVDESREFIAKKFNASTNEIFFTSGGSESNNWVLRGLTHNAIDKSLHIITSKIEHPAMLETLYKLEQKGVSVSYIDIDHNGLVDPSDVRKAIQDNTVLVSIMFANNEIGTIQPIKEIGEICQEEGVLFHTDAIQAIGSQEIDVKSLNVDLMSFSAHKFHGPKGIGGLYKKSGIKLHPLITGGHQERGERAGTTPTPLIVGMAKALEISHLNMEKDNIYITNLRDYFINAILTNISHTYLNGSQENRLPNNVNISFEFIEGESLLMLLDLEHIAVSSGSACASGALEASHVIQALGVQDELSHSSIRFSLSAETTKEELDYTVKSLIKSVERLRTLSPLYDSETGDRKNV